MGIDIFTIDAFAEGPFQGNPAGVCFPPEPRDPEWMQAVAREMNLAETAFVVPRPGPDAGHDLRWFTPAVEVALCGHATLASAHALWQTGRLPAGRVARFRTHSGWLTATRDGDGDGDVITLDFPALATEPCAAPAGLAEHLGVDIAWTGESGDDFLVELADEATVRGLQPEHTALARRLAEVGKRGVIVTARGDASASDGFDFVSRFFAPGVGIPEDPVTGAAHCVLTPYWADKLGKQEMRAYQASARGGVVGVHLRDDRVKLRGRAVTVLRGELLV